MLKLQEKHQIIVDNKHNKLDRNEWYFRITGACFNGIINTKNQMMKYY